jgi:hypothetical protein
MTRLGFQHRYRSKKSLDIRHSPYPIVQFAEEVGCLLPFTFKLRVHLEGMSNRANIMAENSTQRGIALVGRRRLVDFHLADIHCGIWIDVGSNPVVS